MPPRDRRAGRPPLNTSRLFTGGTEGGESDLDYLLAGGSEETTTRAAERGFPVRQLPVGAVAPDPNQLRRLPHPDDLLQREEQGDVTVAPLLTSLRALGRSIRAQGQIQPVIVYPDRDEAHPEVTHRLLNGQRRWTAIVLEGLPTIWAVEVPRPSEVERLQRQFDENERREDFTDMERAWAIVALREALTAEHGSEVSWTEVEARLGLSDSRRRDLLRLLRLAPGGQDLALRYRWSEWTLRPLHMAISAHEIDAETATEILVAFARDGQEVTAPLVAAAVARQRGVPDEVTASLHSLIGAAASMAGSGEETGGQGETALRRGSPSGHLQTSGDLVARLQRVRRGMELVTSEAQRGVDAPTRAVLLQEAFALMQSLEQLVQMLGGRSTD